MIGFVRNVFRVLDSYKRIIDLNNNGNNVSFKSKIGNNVSLEGRNIIGAKTYLNESYFGYASYTGNNCFLPRVKVGKFCSIANGVKIIIGNHPTQEFVSTHPLFYSSKSFKELKFLKKNIYNEYAFADDKNRYYCVIENDVWIGEDAKLMNGIKIGNGAIIATGAIVTKDVEPYSIVGGIPARIIRYRFSIDQINSLVESKWWEKDISIIKNNIEAFRKVDEFISIRDNMN